MPIPSVHGFKTVPVGTMHKWLQISLDGEATENQNPIYFFIPLAPLDRLLLDRLNDRWGLLAGLSKDARHDALVEHIFHNWEWSFIVQSNMFNIFLSEEEDEKALTTAGKYQRALHMMGSSKPHGRSRFRATLLSAENEDFLARLGDQPLFDVNFVPSLKDGKYWDILASMFLRAPKQMLFWMNAPERRQVLNRRNDTLEWVVSHYEIWKLARIFDLASRRPENAHAVVRIFSTPPYSAVALFTLRHADESNSGLIEDDDGAGSDESGERSENEDSFNSSGGEDKQTERSKNQTTREDPGGSVTLFDFLNPNGASLSTVAASQLGSGKWHFWALISNQIRPEEVFDRSEILRQHRTKVWPESDLMLAPGSYLEVIPWEELVLIDAAQVSHFVANNSDNDGKGEEGNTRFCLWDVPPRIAEEHQFIGDEEVFEYRLCHQLSSPGYLIKNKPLFKLTPLDKSSCCFDFKYFWRLWNDCALTIEPESDTIYVLSTIPGGRFRGTWAIYDELAAVRRERRGVDHTNSDESHVSIFKRILGSHYREEHHELLMYIDQSQLEIERIDIASGSFGSITTAVWHRPASFEHKEATKVNVVLKRLQRKYIANNSARFIHELLVAYAGLTGQGTNCTEFFGITEISLHDDCQPCLVFKRASEGHLLGYLQTNNHIRNWNLIVKALCGVFEGLGTLHSRNILHRDIHPGNILMDIRPSVEYPSQTESVVELCDFGQGKIIANDVRSVFSLTNKLAASRYQAPELGAGEEYTKASDVYSAGVFVFDILRISVESLPEGSPALIPKMLWEICEGCMDRNPTRRPEAKRVVLELEDLCDDDIPEDRYDLVDMVDLVDIWKTNSGHQNFISLTQEVSPAFSERLRSRPLFD